MSDKNKQPAFTARIPSQRAGLVTVATKSCTAVGIGLSALVRQDEKGVEFSKRKEQTLGFTQDYHNSFSPPWSGRRASSSFNFVLEFFSV